MDVQQETTLKDVIISYVGNRVLSEMTEEEIGTKEEIEINSDMVIRVLAEEFPEVMLYHAERNWLLGYERGLEDMKNVEGLHKEQTEDL